MVLIRHSLRDVAAPANGRPQTVPPGGGPGPATGRGTGSRAGRGGPPGARTAAATWPGPDGRKAQWVITENNRPGTTAWKIRHPKGSIAGFASRTYAHRGQQVRLYVTTVAAEFRAEAYRMGYYQGKGARLVWQSAEIAGKVQQRCPVTAGINMVSCANWTPSVILTVSAAFVPGGYLIKLVGSGGQAELRAAHRVGPVQHRHLRGAERCPHLAGVEFLRGLRLLPGRWVRPAREYPLCSRARVVSFDRPYAAEEGSGNFLSLEYPLVRFAEQHGLDVTYVTDQAVAQHPRYLLRHRVLLTLGHDECWSLSERTAVVAAHDAGMNIVFFGASRSCGMSGCSPRHSGPAARRSTTGMPRRTRSTGRAAG